MVETEDGERERRKREEEPGDFIVLGSGPTS
jgi:hypothetical protein